MVPVWKQQLHQGRPSVRDRNRGSGARGGDGSHRTDTDDGRETPGRTEVARVAKSTTSGRRPPAQEADETGTQQSVTSRPETGTGGPEPAGGTEVTAPEGKTEEDFKLPSPSPSNYQRERVPARGAPLPKPTEAKWRDSSASGQRRKTRKRDAWGVDRPCL